MKADITYNYNNNFKHPSLLQSVLYGAVGTLGSMGGFGSLTGLGGFGCCGGGSLFGFGNPASTSLFNYGNPAGMSLFGGGFGCCGGGYGMGYGMGYGCDTSDGAVVSTLGTMAGAFGIGALIQSIGKKKTTTTPGSTTTTGSTTSTNTKPKKSEAEYKKLAESKVSFSIKNAVTKAKNAVSIAEKQAPIISDYTDKKDQAEKDLKSLTHVEKPAEPAQNATEAKKKQYETAKGKYDEYIQRKEFFEGKIKEANEKLKEARQALYDAHITDIDVFLASPEEILTKAKAMEENANTDYNNALDDAVKQLKKADGETKKTGETEETGDAGETEANGKYTKTGQDTPSKQDAPSAKECIDALNKVDGNSLTRAIDGKDSGNDQLDALKDAISRFENNPSKVTKEDINQLMKFIDNDGNIRNVTINNDSREDTNAALEKVKSWINSNNNDIKLLNKVLNDTEHQTTNKSLDSLVDKGFGKKFDTNVSGTKKTVYKIGDKVFEKGDDNNAIELSKKKNINILRKAEYEKKNNATT